MHLQLVLERVTFLVGGVGFLLGGASYVLESQGRNFMQGVTNGYEMYSALIGVHCCLNYFAQCRTTHCTHHAKARMVFLADWYRHYLPGQFHRFSES
jgi:hypothetical protein